MEFFGWLFEVLMPSVLGTYESTRKESTLATDRRHSCHGAGKTLAAFIGPPSQTATLAGRQESHSACPGGRIARAPECAGGLRPIPATDRAVCRPGHLGKR